MMECHINVLDFTPSPKSQCSVNSNWLVKPFANSSGLIAVVFFNRWNWVCFRPFTLLFLWKLGWSCLVFMAAIQTMPVLKKNGRNSFILQNRWWPSRPTLQTTIYLLERRSQDVLCYFVLTVSNCLSMHSLLREATLHLLILWKSSQAGSLLLIGQKKKTASTEEEALKLSNQATAGHRKALVDVSEMLEIRASGHPRTQ